MKESLSLDNKIINGKEIASRYSNILTEQLLHLWNKFAFRPKLIILLVGNHPASEVYVNRKVVVGINLGFDVQVHRFEESVDTKTIQEAIFQYNLDKTVNGMILQLPIPIHINKDILLDSISSIKDVDGLTSINQGKLLTGRIDKQTLLPATALGVFRLAQITHSDISGMDVLVIGSSNIVGKPSALLFNRAQATVTIAHSQTKNLQEKCQKADIIVSATGVPNLVNGTMIKKGCTIIDVGISRIKQESKTKIVGDVDFESCYEIVGKITPVPNGVGPMTIAFLLQNVLIASLIQNTDFDIINEGEIFWYM